MDETPKWNPRAAALALKAFQQGVLGHELVGPIAFDSPEADILRRWTKVHGAVLIERSGMGTRSCNDAPGKEIFGVYGCLCKECELLAIDFVMRTSIALIAQGAGDRSYFPESPTEVRLEERQISVCEERRRASFLEWAQQQLAVVRREVRRIAHEEARKEVRMQFPREREKAIQRRQKRDDLIRMSFEQQRELERPCRTQP